MQEFFNWQGVIGTVAGVIGTIVSIFVYFKSQKIEKFLEKEKERLTERVSFILKDGNREKTLPFLRRQEVIRGEIQGRLGTIPMVVKGTRYSIEFTNSLEFYEQIDKIHEGSAYSGNSNLIIKCTKEEFDQFNFDLPKIEAKKAVKKVKENNDK